PNCEPPASRHAFSRMRLKTMPPFPIAGALYREAGMTAMNPQTLESHVLGKWTRGDGVETSLVDPVSGDMIGTASAKGVDLRRALAFARKQGQGALRALSYVERAKLLGSVADTLAANRTKYEAIAIQNSGNTKSDAAIDIDGGIGTLKYFARLG